MALSPEQEARLATLEAKEAAYLASQQAAGADAMPPTPTPAPGAIPRSTDAVEPQLTPLPTPTPNREPTAKAVPYYDTLPDWMSMPEFGPIASPLAFFATSATGADETEKILKAQFPTVKTERAGPNKDFIIFTSGQDGKKYVWKPGAQPSDVLRGLVAAAPAVVGGGIGMRVASKMLPAIAGQGLAASMAAGAVDGMAGAATNEMIQARAGGDAELAPVVMGGAFGGAVPMVGRGMRGTTAAALGKGVPATAAESQAVDVVGETLAKAARGDATAAANFAAQAAPDPTALAAANRLGMTDLIDPDQLTRNEGVQRVVQAAKAADPVAQRAEREAVDAMGVRAKQVLADLAGGEDGSALNANVRAGLEKQIQDSRIQYKELYAKQDALTPRDIPAPAPATLALASKEAAEISGRRAKEVPKGLRALISKLTPVDGVEPTRAMLELQRKELGRGIKNKGPFKDLEPGIAKKLFESIDGDLQEVAKAYNVGDERLAAVEAFKAHQAFKADAVTVLASKAGDELAGSILPGLADSTKALSGGRPDDFVKIIMAAPKELRTQVADTAMVSALVKNGKAEIPQYLAWFEGLNRNKESMAAFNKYVRPETREALRDVYDALRPVINVTSRGARGVRAQEVLPVAGGGAARFAKQVLGVSAGFAADAAAQKAGLPVPPGAAGILSAFLMSKLSVEKVPVVDATLAFLKSGAGRAAFTAADRSAPVSRGFIANLAASAPYRRFAEAAGMRPSTAVGWLEEAITGAGSARASSEQGGYMARPVKKESE